jgi:hypothetical protein
MANALFSVSLTRTDCITFRLSCVCSDVGCNSATKGTVAGCCIGLASTQCGSCDVSRLEAHLFVQLITAHNPCWWRPANFPISHPPPHYHASLLILKGVFAIQNYRRMEFYYNEWLDGGLFYGFVLKKDVIKLWIRRKMKMDKEKLFNAWP